MSESLQNLVSIVGPTAVGKTSFALAAAEKILEAKPELQGANLVSADSRQVYQGLEVLSGADVPAEFELTTDDDEFSYAYFEKDKVRLHGVAIIEPAVEWSVSHFHQLAWEVIEQVQTQNRLVILVGGTGLYHEQVMNFDPALRVGPNQRVRQKAEKMTVRALQDWAHQVNPERFAELNRSDRYNPRRLIRVIEIGLAEPEPVAKPTLAKKLEQHFVGLKQDLVVIEQKIEARVKERFKAGAVQEVKQLTQEEKLPALSALGVSELQQYLNGELDEAEALELWTLHEIQYARKQLGWWKGKPIKWFELNNSRWKEKAFTYILDLCSNSLKTKNKL